MDWIKVEKGTPDKTEILHIARVCGVSANEAFGAWFRLWAWFDGETGDGHLRFLRKEDCDAKAGLAGIGEALAAVGWIEFGDGGAVVINWDRHNGDSAKKRAMATLRKQRERTSTGCKPEYRPWEQA